MKNPEKIVIVGNSGAAISAIKSIREAENSSPITVVSKEKWPAYSPVLTTYYIGDRVDRSKFFLVDEQFYKTSGVELLLGHEVVEIDPRQQNVRLKNDTTLPFDRLLIASGASAKKPSLEGIDLENVFTLRTLEDAEKIRAASRTAREVIFVGAGLVSLQVASQLCRSDLKMTFLVSSDQILSQNLDQAGSRIVQQRIEKMGSSFLFNRDIKSIEKKKGRLTVTTSQNERLQGDIVFIGKGVTPNIQFVQDRLETHKGILVNGRLQTNVETIYAAGDVAEGTNPLTKQREIIANWPNACLQGKVAGLNMIGQEEAFTDFTPRNVTQIFELLIASVGLVHEVEGIKSEQLEISDPQREIYSKVFLQGANIVGAIMIGDINDIGLIHSSIHEGNPVVPDKEFFSKYLLRLDGPLASF
jgi:NAD(P)H-nitrite reductase large subunit